MKSESIPKFSVIVCTHNPRRDYLTRTLQALAAQSLAKDQWELLLIDNQSEPPLTPAWFGTELPNVRVVREDTLGLTPARLRGIREAKGELLVFVDDDNELATDYLQVAADLAQQHPHVGVFSASICAEYETTPPEGIHLFEPFLAIRRLDSDVIGDKPGPHVLPIGAGMVVRCAVAAKHATTMETGRQDLDRKGNALLAAGDTDFGYTAFDLGLSCGAFRGLTLKHLIAARRLKYEYLEKLTEDVFYSLLLLAQLRGEPPISRLRKLKLQLGLLLARRHPAPVYRCFRSAILRAKIRLASESHPTLPRKS